MDSALIFFSLFFIVPGGWSLRDVTLRILPPAVQRGGEATFLCHYDLEGAHLYAVKWYRGQREFYRYSPNENPPIKIFAFAGINVDLSMSNASQVVLRQVGFNLSGNISCEVTTESPHFSTAVVSKQLSVIELPKSGPVVQTDKERHELGDTLRANCSTAPSRPPAQILFHVNDIPVKGGDITTRETGSGLTTTHRRLELKLEAGQFRGVPIIVKCTALVAGFNQSAQLSVGPRTTEPVPERVTSPSGSSRLEPCFVLLLLLYLTR
ncbi:uncharacterized protein [Halyomorpha halys]|uniref:uncharacterized protein n=1 Tax=Halyomorpha halys TaxID=286706 RepID=UPI0006D4FD2B|nr:uncharacterized protein LOC106689285 [Halyomorpha halys]